MLVCSNWYWKKRRKQFCLSRDSDPSHQDGRRESSRWNSSLTCFSDSIDIKVAFIGPPCRPGIRFFWHDLIMIDWKWKNEFIAFKTNSSKLIESVKRDRNRFNWNFYNFVNTGLFKNYLQLQVLSNPVHSCLSAKALGILLRKNMRVLNLRF